MSGPKGILRKPATTTAREAAVRRVSWDPQVSPPHPSRTCADCGHRSFKKPRRVFQICEECFMPLCDLCVNGNPLCTACFFAMFDMDDTCAEYDYNKHMLIYC